MYYIIRQSDLSIMGTKKWVTRDELFEKEHVIVSFSDVAEANAVRDSFSKELKSKTAVVANKRLKSCWFISIDSRGKFSLTTKDLNDPDNKELEGKHFDSFGVVQSFCTKKTQVNQPAKEQPKPTLIQPDFDSDWFCDGDYFADNGLTKKETTSISSFNQQWIYTEEKQELQEGTLCGDSMPFTEEPCVAQTLKLFDHIIDFLEWICELKKVPRSY